MQIDKRLLRAAEWVRDGVTVADIGTDHAYLPVYLVQTGRCPAAIAADIGEQPAAAARRTVTAAGLCDQIDVRVGDGLSVLAPDEAQDIVIAGMGGETIAAILNGAPWLRADTGHRLILQPMTKTAELRHFLLQTGFAIDEEHLIEDGRHLYVVMRAHFAGNPPASDPLCDYIGALSPAEGRRYFEKEAAHLRRKAAGLLQAHGDDEAAVRQAAMRQAAALQTLADRLTAFYTET